MALLCPQCGYENPDQSGFCVRCGNRLSTNGQPLNAGSSSSQSLPTYAAMAAPPAAPPSYSPPPPSYNPPTGPFYASAAQSAPPSAALAAPLPSASLPVQMGTGQGLASIRRAFAGYGRLMYNDSWLVNRGAEQANAARNTVFEILRTRNIVGLNVNQQRLIERGLLMEERDYLVAHRGVATVFVYTAPAGNDLYVSRAITVLPAINNVRVAGAILAACIMFIGFFVRPDPYALLGGNILSYAIAELFDLVSIAILLIFIILAIRSFIYWLFERDFWYLLRLNKLNDFQLDDIMLLEQVTDDTVRTAVKRVGLDASQITPPPAGYRATQRMRAI